MDGVTQTSLSSFLSTFDWFLLTFDLDLSYAGIASHLGRLRPRYFFAINTKFEYETVHKFNDVHENHGMPGTDKILFGGSSAQNPVSKIQRYLLYKNVPLFYGCLLLLPLLSFFSLPLSFPYTRLPNKQSTARKQAELARQTDSQIK